MFEKYYRQLVVVLLLVLIAAQIAGLVMTSNRNTQLDKTAALKAASCKTVTDVVSSQLISLGTNYQKDVYENSRVDNIYKQALMQGEYQFTAEQMIAEIAAACQ